MLHIILFLFKIIGILLLSVLGLVLFLAVITLFVPIRYRVEIRHGEDLFFLKGRVNWLLHILHVSLSHVEGIWHIQARVFGFVIFDNLKPRKSGRPEETGKTKKAEKPKKAEKLKKARKLEKAKKPIQEENTKEQRKAYPETSGDRGTVIREDKESEPGAVKLPDTKEQGTHPEAAGEASAKVWDTGEETTQIRTKPAVPMIEEKEQNTGSAKDASYETPSDRQSLFKKIAGRFRRIREKLVNTAGEWKRRIKSLFAAVSSAKNKVDLIMNFIRNELNREGFHITWISLKKLLKHILPKKLKSKLVFGTGDPCSTGQALGAMSIFYSFYGDRIQITPDFERSRLEGEHFARGRIRLVTILIIVIRLLFDKRFKKLKNNFIILKEAL